MQKSKCAGAIAACVMAVSPFVSTAVSAGGYITPEEYKAKKKQILDGM